MDLRERPEASFVRHPWETARCDHFLSVARVFAPARGLRSVLDVGAGDAWVAGELARASSDCRVTCWDLGYTPEVVAGLAAQAPEGVEFAASQPSRRFDLILLLDVLEHVEKDDLLLGDLVRGNLEPGGRVIVSVPAWPGLFSRHDVALGHHRRYRPAEARALVEGADLRMLAGGGLFHGLLSLRFLGRLLERRGEPAETEADPLAWSGSPGLARFVAAGLRLENALSRALARRRVELPGLSWWAVCEKSA